MIDIDKLIERWENSALELREAETLINLLIIHNKRLEKSVSISKLEELIAKSNEPFTNYAYSRSDLQKLVREAKQ